MKKTCFIGIMAAIALMAASALVTADISAVANSGFEADAAYLSGGVGFVPLTGWEDWTTSTENPWAVHLVQEGLAGVVGTDYGPGASDIVWLGLASEGSGTVTGGIYQDLGTTATNGFYVAQAFLQPFTAYYHATPFKFSLRDTSDNELASVQNDDVKWIVPNALEMMAGTPVILAEVTYQATSAVNLRVQIESLPDPVITRLDVDDIVVVNEKLGANTPNPGRWALQSVPTTSLQWAAGSTSGINGYEVFLGSSPDQLVSQGTTASTSFPVSLTPNTIYYWRVDAQTSGVTTVPGMIWAFRTELQLPVIDVQPVDTSGELGGNATFTVTASNPAGGSLSYQWYYDPNTLTPGDEVALTNGTDYSGVDTATLTILGIEESDAGKPLFCRVINVYGVTDTDLVTVEIPRLIYYWPFNDSLNEVKGSGSFVQAIGDPDYETGMVGNALSLDGDDGVLYNNIWLHYGDMEQPVAKRYIRNSTGSSTMTLWIKPANVAQLYIKIFNFANRNLGYANNAGFLRLHDVIWTGDEATNDDADFANIIANNQWTFLALRFSAHATTLFVNGVAHIERPRDGKSYASPTASNFYMGCASTTSQFFDGAIDEFKVYNYELSDAQIAQEYANIAGVPVCVQDNPANIVEEGNCAVDLADFAVLAAQWLQDCNVYPAP